MENLIGKQFGTYQIISQCGQGGMATVYKAYQPSMDRYVALKVLPQFHASDPEFLGRFEQEAKALAQLQHPHILPVYDYGESEGFTYFVMPLMQDGNLGELLATEKLSHFRINQIISQIGGALEFAHSRGFIHRDVKPSNILLDESGNCMLMDFGIAKIIEGSKVFTQTGGILGTPAYMSPEQGTGKEIDHRSDIYSLGIILYEMVTGKTPFEAETPVAVIFKHVHDPLPPPSTIVPDLPEDIERVILKSLVKDPEERFQTVRDMIDALSTAVSTSLQEPTVAVSPPTVQESVSEFEATVVEEQVEIETEVETPRIVPKDEIAQVSAKVHPGKKTPILRSALYLAGAVALILIGIWLANAGIFAEKESEPSGTLVTGSNQIESSPPATSSPDITETPPPVDTATSEGPEPTEPPPDPPYVAVPTVGVPGVGLEALFFLGFDPNVYPFDDVRIRRAIASAIDRDLVIEQIRALHPDKIYGPATNITPPDILGYDLYGEIGNFFDPEMAQQLMAEAGYPNGEGFPLINLYHRDSDRYRVLAQQVSMSLNENLGINISLSATQINYPEVPAFYILGWQADYLDPHNFLYEPYCGEVDRDFILSDEYFAAADTINNETNRGMKRSLIQDFSKTFCFDKWDPHLPLGAEYKSLLDRAMEEDSDEIVRGLYVDAERILVEIETFIVPLFHSSQ